MKRRKSRIPPHVMIVLFAGVVSAVAIGSILGRRVEQDNLRACQAGVEAAARLVADQRPSAVARACAPLVARAPCREAFLVFADDRSPARLGALVRTCRDAYCERLGADPPAACGATVPTPDHAAALFEAIFRKEHGGNDDAAALGATIAAALGGATD